MTGDAPQPGETPRDDGTPWSHTDPASPWWRADDGNPAADGPGAVAAAPGAAAQGTAATPTLDPPRAAQHTGVAAEAHQAGGQDALAALTGEPPQPVEAGSAVPDRLPVERRTAADPPTIRPPVERRAAAEPVVIRPPVERRATVEPPTIRPPVAQQPTHPAAARGHSTPRHAQQQPVAPAGPPAAAAEQAGKEQAGKEQAELRQPGAKITEHDHDLVDAERYNTDGVGTVYAARARVQPAGPEQTSSTDERAEAVPDVMVLPEPDRNRPTVALDRGAVAGRPPSGLSRLRSARADHARADRALQDRVRQERTAALLETSTFWKTEEERRAPSWPPAETLDQPPGLTRPTRSSRRRARQPRRPAAGLFGLLTLGLIAAFFAWVSAEPFWLATGHGDRGTATVERCTGSGVTQRCTGRFVAADGTYQVDRLALYGVEPARSTAGVSTPARMVDSESRQAYIGGPGLLMHLRWVLSFVLVLLCGLGIAGLTGARRLDTAPARRGALLASLAGPLALLAGFLAVSY